MQNDACLLGFPDYRAQARRLAELARLPYREIDVHRFPDGESKLRLPGELAGRVVICQALDRPDRKLVELLLAADTARELGARSVILVAPYLCYMRQDKAFQSGEAVSQRVIGKFLADHFDAVITVDAHLHRVERLSQAIPLRQALNLSAAESMGRFLHDASPQALLLGPDAESEQWVAAIAEHDHFDWCIARKTRFGDSEVEIRLPERDFGGRRVVLVDDVASTGTTLAKAAAELLRRQAAGVGVLVTHALFAGDACARLERAGVTDIWSCDSIAHPSNRVSLAPLLTEGLRKVLEA